MMVYLFHDKNIRYHLQAEHRVISNQKSQTEVLFRLSFVILDVYQKYAEYFLLIDLTYILVQSLHLLNSKWKDETEKYR